MSNLQVFMANDGTFWIPSVCGTKSFGPYQTQALAEQGQLEYYAFLESQQPQTVPKATNVDSLVVEHLVLRARRDEIKARHKAELEPLEKQLELSEANLIGALNDSGASSISTPAGTIFLGPPRVYPKIQDHDALRGFILQSGEVALLGNKVSSTALKAWMESHGGQTPPGVTATYERTLNVRRS